MARSMMMIEYNDTNIGIGAAYDTPEEKEIERLNQQVSKLRSQLSTANETIGRYKAIADRLVAWDKKWPKGTIFSYGRLEECHGELDSCVDALKLITQPPGG